MFISNGSAQAQVQSTMKFKSCSIFMFISNGSAQAQVHSTDFQITRSMQKHHMRA